VESKAEAKYRPGQAVKAFHPQTMGVVYGGKITSIEGDTAVVDFGVGIGKKTHFRIPLSHIVD
jgi:FKBP-type peptidyl-prolyl cis-trans isomerase 2